MKDTLERASNARAQTSTKIEDLRAMMDGLEREAAHTEDQIRARYQRLRETLD
jgi:uncharacterized protein (DUF3084 family)